jgi:hypothetical protein
MRRFLQLTRHNWRLAFAALFAVFFTRLALWLMPFRILHRWSKAASEAGTSRDPMRRLRIAHAVRTASVLVPYASCLTQALTTQWLLRFKGERARLCLGALRGEGGRLQAHAWLEHDGGVLIGDLPDLGRYRIFRHLASNS